MFRSGSPRPLSKPRNTFSLFTTPLSRAARPLCPIRHLARCPPFTVDLSDTLHQWETYINENPTHDIRSTCTHLHELYQKAKAMKINKNLNNLFPYQEENGVEKIFEDFLPEYEVRETIDDEKDLSIRYPKLLNDSGDFYTQYTHSNMTIMKKRPYESTDNTNEGKGKETKFLWHLFLLGPSPKRTLISRQNLIKTKSPVIENILSIERSLLIFF